MRKLMFVIPFLFAAIALSAQTTVIRDAHAEARKVGSFTAIEVSNGIDLIIKQGNEDAVAVSASTPEIRSRLKTEVTNGKLKIYFDSYGYRNSTAKKELKAYVSFKTLVSLEANSGSDVNTDGNITVGKLDITLSSGADFEGTVTATSLDIDQSSGSDMTIKGKVASLSVSTSSGSDFDGYELVSDNCKADASSGSDIEITVNKTLDAQASSGGNISYKGSGVITNVTNSSGGKIKKQG